MTVLVSGSHEALCCPFSFSSQFDQLFEALLFTNRSWRERIALNKTCESESCYRPGRASVIQTICGVHSCKSSVLWSKLNLSSINMSRYLYHLSSCSIAWPLTTLASEIDQHVAILSCKNEFSHHWTKSASRSKAAHLSHGGIWVEGYW